MERQIIRKDYYEIPVREKVYLFTRRATILPYNLLRYKLRRVIPTRFKSAGDVFSYYFKTWEMPYVVRKIGIKDNDTRAGVKLATYFHTLTNVTGSIIQLSKTKSVRVETDCPLQNRVSRDFCENKLSYPTFCGICSVLNSDIVHSHPSYLSGGDDTCTLIFEMNQEPGDE